MTTTNRSSSFVLCLALLLGLGACATAPGPKPSAGAAQSPANSSPPVPPSATPAAPAPSTQAAPAPLYPNTALSTISGSSPLSATAVAAVAPPAELWERIRVGFSVPKLTGELVTQQEQFYASKPEYLQRMVQRSRKYLFHIVEEIERRGMPSELALLPFIESAFNPQAVSVARAAGMWQFIPSTGRQYDLKQNVFRDDRRDVLASTRAALDYLQKLHRMFGDWHLALAAYNCGEGCVGRAITRASRNNNGTSYAELDLPRETRYYVPKLQAMINIVANPQAFGVELPLIENHPYFQSVTITRDIDVELAARLADVKLEDFKALNPSLNRPVILAAGVPQILLPWDNANVFQRNFEAHQAGRYASWTAWTAPATMSVAEAAKRTGMSEADLRAVNAIPPRMLIKAGSVLLAPRQSPTTQDVPSHVADNGQLSLEPELVKRRSTIKAGKNDSVVTIAKRYKVSASEVAQWNKVATDHSFKQGQAIVVYTLVKASTGKRSSHAHARGKPGSKVAKNTRSHKNVVAKRAGSSKTQAKR